MAMKRGRKPQLVKAPKNTGGGLPFFNPYGASNSADMGPVKPPVKKKKPPISVDQELGAQ